MTNDKYQVLYNLLALLPIAVLVVLSLWKNLNVAVTVSFMVTAALFFYWQAPASHLFASLFAALLSSVTILTRLTALRGLPG